MPNKIITYIYITFYSGQVLLVVLSCLILKPSEINFSVYPFTDEEIEVQEEVK